MADRGLGLRGGRVTAGRESLCAALRRAIDFIELIAEEAKGEDDLWSYDRAGYVLDEIRPVLEGALGGTGTRNVCPECGAGSWHDVIEPRHAAACSKAAA